MKKFELGSANLDDEWSKAKERVAQISKEADDSAKDPRSLYERLQEQRQIKFEAEMEEQRGMAAVRTLETQDLEFLEAVEREQAEKQKRLEEEVIRQRELIKKKLQEDSTNVEQSETEELKKLIRQRPSIATASSGLKQKDLLKAAIRKKR